MWFGDYEAWSGGPEAVEEVPQLGHLVVIGSVEPSGALTPLLHQTGLLEDAEVLGDRRPGHVVEVVGDGGSRQLLRPHQPE